MLDDPRTVALGNEPVRVGDSVGGGVTSGGYGYTVAASIAYAYLSVTADPGTRPAVEIDGTRAPGIVADTPLYDPQALRIRA